MSTEITGPSFVGGNPQSHIANRQTRSKHHHISVSFSGIYFMLLAVSMLFVAYQFAQSNAYYFSLCLFSVALVSLAHTYWQLARLRLRLPATILVAADRAFQLPVNVDPAYAQTSLIHGQCALAGNEAWIPFQASSRKGRYALSLGPQRRGVYHLQSVRVRLDCVLGVFSVSKCLNVDSRIEVYPASDAARARVAESEQDELDLQPYRAGDAVHRIDWRGAARGRELHCVRQAEPDSDVDDLRLNSSADLESELRRLSAEVLARRNGYRSFGLQLGEQSIAAGQGAAHVTYCLSQLASYRTQRHDLKLHDRLHAEDVEAEDNSSSSAISNKGLLMLCALSALSVYAFDPVWLPMGFCLAALLWRLTRGSLQYTWRNQVALSSFIVLGATYQCLSLSSVFSFYTAVSYLALALGSKLLFYRPQRDALATVALFCLISCMAFYNSDHPLQVLLGLTALFSGMLYVISVYQSDLSAYRISVLLSLSIVCASLFYALLPPPKQALWQLPMSSSSSSVGLANEVTPGSMSKLSQNHRVVFRAYVPQALARNNDFFWRASVFDAFDGRSWKHGNVSDYIWKPAQQSVNQAPVDASYRVEFEMVQDQRLMRLDLPGMEAQLNIDHIESGQGELFLSRGEPVTQYRVSVLPPKSLHQGLMPFASERKKNPSLSPQQRQRYLALPETLAPKTRHMISEWRQAAGGQPQAQQIMRKALAFFANGGFAYSTENIRVDGDLVDGFLFGQRRGYCEHYASSFVFMMRAAGIPARVVSGYRGADYQADGNYFIVRQSFAHAWAEVWLPQQGWSRVDPTAYVSVDSGAQGLLEQLSSLARQLSLRLTWLQELDSNRLLLALLLCLSLVLLLPTLKPLLAALRYLPRAALNRPPRAIEAAAGDSFRQLARSWRRHGVALGDNDDIETWAASVSQQRPDLKPQVAEFTHLYNNLRYGRDKAWGQLQRLSRLQRQLKM